MMAEVKLEKEDLTYQLKSVIKQLELLEPDSSEYRRLWDKKYRLEREVKQEYC